MATISTFSLPRTRLQRQIVVKPRTTIKPPQSFYKFEQFTKTTNRRSHVMRLSTKDLGSKVSPYRSPVETIKHIYDCINEKNLKELGELIANDCFIDDYSFFVPFQGKKETVSFFEQLIACMGRNVKFGLDLIICEEDGFNVAVMWHLEWRKKMIPLTKGGSFYELSMLKGSKLVIRKAHVLVESPIKPGAFALGLFVTITSLFDAFPQATQWFLDRPYVIVNIILKIYSVTFGPFITPFLKYYPKVFNFFTLLCNFTLKILFWVSKIFPF